MAEVKSDETEATRSGDISNEDDGCFVMPEPVETKFSTKTWRDDLALIVEEKHLYVNMCVLACSSPVFDAMFSGDFKEKGQREITLTGKKFDDFVEFLRCIYPGTISVTRDNVFKVLPLAHEYQVDFLKSACDVCLVQRILQNETPEEVYVIMEMACNYKLDQVREKCIEIVAERPEGEFEEFESKFPDDVINAIRAEMLQSLKTKYKDVFGHIQTSRALYQFLGCEAKQKDLVEKYMNGQVLGGTSMVNLNVSRPTFEAPTLIRIGRKTFKVNMKSTYGGIQNGITVGVQQHSKYKHSTIECICAVLFPNWMNGKKDSNHVSKFQLNTGRAFETDIDTSFLSNEEAGFIYKGHIAMRIYLFCW